jgi:hypothetical protein
MPWERLDGKVTTAHRQRLAVVYVRQSSKQQVLDHGESTRLQYALVDRAMALGWAASRVVVIDDDLGKSGASAVDRAGFQRLVTEITMGHVGLVLGIEMSRLARSGRDWYQLLELCSLSGALLADADGVYDPGEYNDRLLLGLKGTMSEALCRYLHKASYADLAVMPIWCREPLWWKDSRDHEVGIALEAVEPGQEGVVGLVASQRGVRGVTELTYPAARRSSKYAATHPHAGPAGPAPAPNTDPS